MTTLNSQPRVPYPLQIPTRKSQTPSSQPKSTCTVSGVPVSSGKGQSSNSSTETIVPATATLVGTPFSAGTEIKRFFGVSKATLPVPVPTPAPHHSRQMSQDSLTSQSSVEPHSRPHSPARSATPSLDEKKQSSFKERFSMAKLSRKPSASSSTNKSCNDTVSLHKKYGVCEKGYIGKGATAVVRLIHHLDRTTRNEKLYAVKEFRKRRKDESEKDYVKKLTSEFCISSTMRHPNIVETVDLVQDQQQRWCQVMEYCPGGDLYTVIREGNMAAPEINCCFKQIIQGVAYLHSMGVAHRDVKPENLLLDAYGHIKITDFGVADVFRMCWEKTTHLSRGFCGSEPYIAPEQFAGKPYDARRVDVWSCGVVLYAMYCKGVPFRTATKRDPNYVRYLEARSQGKTYEPFRRLPPKACALITRMLEPDPEKRLSAEDVMNDPWFQSIEVCKNGETPSKQPHHHYTEDYMLNQLKHPSARR
ncbi:hypothetical protein IWQ62_005528 [Dispira parvispora]|uniref:non-specific serine/threonine protein kinase n=1 Tax=Dispira parvispora TaxID=1520584 RepID=A0A9W8AIM0_9FUNG|nr:hypothetical protein IWQ62_005528 [Dispira parvispora]